MSTDTPQRFCITCQHWRPVKTAMQAGIGECRIWPPHGQFNWPRTREIDVCGQWVSSNAIDFATRAPEAAPAAAGERGGEPAGAVAPVASRSTAPQTGALRQDAARPARASKAAAKAADGGRPASLFQP